MITHAPDHTIIDTTGNSRIYRNHRWLGALHFCDYRPYAGHNIADAIGFCLYCIHLLLPAVASNR